MTNNVLVLDLGSSSTRAMWFDAHANLISPIAREPVEFATRQDGASEDDAREAVRRASRVLDQARKHFTGEPAALAISSYAGSLLCLDEDGEPLAPLLTYADTRASEVASTLRREHNELETHARTGCRIRANYSPARIAWIRQTQPALFAKTRWFASMSDYLRFKLLGKLETGISVASWTGLLNRNTGGWDAEWLRILGISEAQLPPIVDSPVALGDGAAANIGSGCDNPARIAVTMGTTSAARIARPHSMTEVSPALWSYRVSRGVGLVGGALTEGGSAHAWVMKTFGLTDADQAEHTISRMQPDAHGLTVLPMFAGERSPGYADRARATLHGFTLDTNAHDVLRAVMESVAMRIGLVIQAVLDSTQAQQTPQLIASGGALLASPAWCQMIADVCNLPLTLCEEAEATARGAALVALGSPALPPKLGRTFEPNPSHHVIYREALHRQQKLYAQLVGGVGD